jgi:hypothetical protein
VIKPAYSVSFLLSINIFVWQNVLYFPNDLRISVGAHRGAIGSGTTLEVGRSPVVKGPLQPDMTFGLM